MRACRPIHRSSFTADHMLDDQTRFNPNGTELWDRDGKLLNSFEIESVQIGNPIEDTPEGMALMDRIRDRAGYEREEFAARFGDAALAARDDVDRAVERAVLGL